MSKLITVFGATGNQGASVIRAILTDGSLANQFKIRAVTRDVSKPATQDLRKKGIEVIAADMNVKSTLVEAIRGSHSVFLVTMPEFLQSGETGQELAHGTNVAEVAKAMGVQHLIFSSLPHVTDVTNGRISTASHFDMKAEIERYIRSEGIPSTFIFAGYFMSNFTVFRLLQKGQDGVYTFACPVDENAQFPLIDAEQDIGKFCVAVMRNRRKVLGKQVLAATDYYTPKRIVSEFEEVTVPETLTERLLETHLLIDDSGYFSGKSLKESQDLLAAVSLRPNTWKDLVEKNKEAF